MLFNRKQMLIASMGEELAGDAELGAFGGVADIPARIHAAQQWSGFLVGSQPAPQGRPLIRVQLPLLYARDWTIHLATPQVPNPNGNNVALPSTALATVRLNWGHHGSIDQVELDWPARGGSITVHGAYVGLSVADPGGGAPALLNANYNAWLSEGAAARANPWQYQPVRTSRLGTINPGAVVIAPAPARARAFYIKMRSGGGPLQEFEIQYLDNAVVRQVLGMELSNSASPVPRLGTNQQNPLAFPPDCNALAIANITAGDVYFDVCIHWLLDLGS